MGSGNRGRVVKRYGLGMDGEWSGSGSGCGSVSGSRNGSVNGRSGSGNGVGMGDEERGWEGYQWGMTARRERGTPGSIS